MEEAVVALCGRAGFFFWLWDAEGCFFFLMLQDNNEAFLFGTNTIHNS